LLIILIFQNKKVRKLIRKNDEVYSFVVTIYATFLGVFLAVDFDNKNTAKNEKKELIKLIQVSQTDLSMSQKGCITHYRIVERWGEIDSLNQRTEGWRNFNEDIDSPEVFSAILLGSTLNKNWSNHSLAALVNLNQNIRSVHKELRLSIMDASKKNFLANLSLYIKLHTLIDNVLVSEIQFQNGKINEEELPKQYKKDLSQLFGKEKVLLD